MAIGRPVYASAKLDWEVRRFWAPDIYIYLTLPAEFRPGFFARLLRRVYIRFPDTSPFHQLRLLHVIGPEAVKKYNNKIYKQGMYTSVHRAIAYAEEGVTQSAATLRANQLYIQGRTRLSAGYVLYGMANRERIDQEIQKVLDAMKKENPAMDVEKKRISVQSHVRSREFRSEGKEVRDKYNEEAKKLKLDTKDPDVLCV